MVHEARKVGEISEGDVYLVDAPLDKQIEAFRKQGIQYPFLIHPSQVAEFRTGNPNFKESWTRTCVVPVGVKNENPVLYDESPFMNPLMASVAVDAHRNTKYPSLPRRSYDFILDLAKTQETLEPEDRNAIVLPTTEDFELVQESDVARFLLRKQTNPYFEKFNHQKILFQNFPTKEIPKDEARGNYLWFNGPDDGSDFDAWGRGLGGGVRAFGVLIKTAEGGSQKFGYALTEVRDAVQIAVPKVLESTGFLGAKEKVLSPLEAGILEELRK